MKVYRGEKVLVDGVGLKPAVVLVQGGKVVGVHDIDHPLEKDWKVVDTGSKVLMPGVVDSHVHINEPGRTDWEGFTTATRAAAAGGVTTLVDMPLNSIPPTTTINNLKTKVSAAAGQCWVDVGFWGGVIPGNSGNLKEMVHVGVPGFKCFLIHSGVDEFPAVTEEDLLLALAQLKGTGASLLFHSESETGSEEQTGDPNNYSTFLLSRPEEMELKAINLIIELARKTRVPCHIVHLSAASALPAIRKARKEGIPLTVETCHHYLNLNSETIPNNATQFKCCPPIREKSNQDQLWEALVQGDIDMVVSDHSPCTPDLKLPGEKDFMNSWGGISSLQFGLSLLWTGSRTRQFSLQDINRLLSLAPAKLAGSTVLNISSVKLYITHLCPISKSKFNIYKS
ncbi:allantoinase, mitochondrial [Eurytemora carolleeae]|uniref:allantoinase, mitochondrial n=1 Tax=Eurytemora carolleeae TaxID=1294199 RepID=UPI000C783AA7|nr:allantoinase, mitochondrial [Eurytemora carolleeae]|eukprot:XP_023320245.1 allantoinase, mitochondrial-like [Eurytemora affinis]